MSTCERPRLITRTCTALSIATLLANCSTTPAPTYFGAHAEQCRSVRPVGEEYRGAIVDGKASRKLYGYIGNDVCEWAYDEKGNLRAVTRKRR